MDSMKTSGRASRSSQKEASEGRYPLDVEAAYNDPACRKKVMDTCYKVLGRFPSLVEDAAQDTWTRALQVKSKKPIDSPIAFLCRLARWVALDTLEHHSPKGVRFESCSLLPGETVNDSYQEIAGMSHADFERGVREILSFLKPLHRSLFILRDLMGRSQKEISRILGYSEAKISGEITAMETKIRQIMGPDGPDDGGGSGALKPKTRTQSREVRQVAARAGKLSRSASKIAKCLLELSALREAREKERDNLSCVPERASRIETGVNFVRDGLSVCYVFTVDVFSPLTLHKRVFFQVEWDDGDHNKPVVWLFHGVAGLVGRVSLYESVQEKSGSFSYIDLN